MVYLYDRAIVDDLIKSFNPGEVDEPVVRVISPEQMVGLAAQIQNDNIKFPIVALSREYDLNSDHPNSSWAQAGVVSVIDPKTNNLYYEKVIPIRLTYAMTILTTNQEDMDEIIRELVFKYTSEYFYTITLPYECNRRVRFGVRLENSSGAVQSSSGEYLETGRLYQSILNLVCDGAVLVNYTPAHLKRMTHEVAIDES